MKKTALLAVALLILNTAALFAFDFGVLLNPNAAWEGKVADDFTMSIALSPWLSVPLSENTDLYFSAGVTNFIEDFQGVDEESWWFRNPWVFQNKWDPDFAFSWVFEVYRAELDHRMDKGRFRMGRFSHSDPLGFVISGLFDGVSYSHDLGKGSLGGGMWYLGTQFKKTANITMTADDRTKYFTVANFNSGDFARDFLFFFDDLPDNYFASQRLMGSLWYENPELPFGLHLNTAFIHQSDLNPQWIMTEYRLHSQYLIGRLAWPFLDRWTATGGVALEMEERDRVRFAAAGELGVSVFLSPSRRDRLSLTGRYSTNGADNSNIAAFAPITTVPQGHMLRARLSGLSVIEAAYISRVMDTLTLEGAATLIFKSPNDIFTNRYFTMGEGDSFLGGDVFLRGIWAPFSDLMLTASLGTFKPAANPRYIWKVNIAASLAVY